MALDQAALAAWRTARGRGGIQTLPALPDFPFPLEGDLSGLAELASRADVPNPLISPANEALQEALKAQKLIQDRRTPEMPEPPGLEQAEYRARLATERWADAILGAFIADPPYCRIPDLPPGGCPPGQVCYYDFEAAGVTGDLTALAIGGYDALDSFRAAMGARAGALPDGAGVSPTAGDDPVSAQPPTPSTLAERSGLSDGPELGLAPGAAAPGRGSGQQKPPRRLHTRSA